MIGAVAFVAGFCAGVAAAMLWAVVQLRNVRRNLINQILSQPPGTFEFPPGRSGSEIPTVPPERKDGAR